MFTVSPVRGSNGVFDRRRDPGAVGGGILDRTFLAIVNFNVAELGPPGGARAFCLCEILPTHRRAQD